MKIISINEYAKVKNEQPAVETIGINELENYIETTDGNIIIVYEEKMNKKVWDVLGQFFDEKNTLNATDLEENSEINIDNAFAKFDEELMMSDRQICIRQINHLEKGEQGTVQLKMMDDGYTVLGTIIDFNFSYGNNLFKPLNKTFLDEFTIVRVF